jgi:hypothetical protein
MTSPAPPEVTQIVEPVVVGGTGRAPALALAASSIPLSLALVGVGIFGVWAVNDGGFAPEQWLPGALAMLGLLVTSLASGDVRARLRTAPVAPLLLGLYVIWSYASILWAQVRGDAFDGANRTLLYFCVYVLFSALPLKEGARVFLLSSWGLTVAAIGAFELLSAAAASRPQGHFVLGRLASPIAYSNANAALFLLAFLPLEVLASRRRGHPLLRIVAGAACAVLVDLAVLGESRGSLAALPLALIVYLTIGRNFLRALAQLAVLAGAVAPTIPPLLAVYSAVVDGRGYTSALSSACAWVGVSALIGAAGSGVLAVIDRRVRVPDRVCVTLRRTAVAVSAVVLVVAVVGFLLVGHPGARVRHAWDDFTTNKRSAPQTVHLVSGVGTSRYDVWRIALLQFAAHPLGGVGADNYLVGYLEQRRTTESSRYPESIEFRALSETGIVGALLFFGFLGVAVRRAVAAARRERVPTAALACLIGAGYWMFHASVDWLWEFPGLTAPALALLGLAAGSLASGAAASGAHERRRGMRTATRRSVVAGTAALAAAAAFFLLAPWLAVRQIDEAVAIGAARPDRASVLLRSAARWNRLSDAPALTEAALAANAGDRVRERRALGDALARNGSSWYTYLMLGIVAGRQHRPAAARAYLARAGSLSPSDPVIRFAQHRLKWGAPLTELEVEHQFLLTTRVLRGAVQRGG